MIGRFTALGLIGLLLGGCGVKAVVTDMTGEVTTLERARVEPARLGVLIGEARGRVRLKKVKTLVLDPARTRMVDGRLYYAARLSMDGDNSGGRGEKGHYFVDAQSILTGRGGEGRFRIVLSDVTKVVVED
jgi:hypothetical protein